MHNAVFIGSGNIANHLAKAFCEKGISIPAVYSRNPDTGRKLAAEAGGTFVAHIADVPDDAGLYILAVNDDSIGEVSAELKANGLVVHCSGLKPMDLLKDHSRHGVFYPLQTFAPGTQPNLSEAPVCIEAGAEEDLAILKSYAGKISGSVKSVSSEQRQYLHLAAVFANNFSNHLFVIARQICDAQGMDFDLLKPLIMQTARNLQHSDPMNNQTGPARRKDLETIEKHLELLGNNADLQTLYKMLTESIRKLHQV